jgi:hypothetical protein
MSISLRNSVDLKCRDCCAADMGANWREYVSVCACHKLSALARPPIVAKRIGMDAKT